MKNYILRLSLVIMCAMMLGLPLRVMATEDVSGNMSETPGDVPQTQNGRSGEQDDAVDDTKEVLVDLREAGYVISIKGNVVEYDYSGSEIEPEIEVMQPDDPDQAVLDKKYYDIEYRDNTNAGEAKIIVTGKDEEGYTGSIETTYMIKAADISSYGMSLSKTTFSYNGKAQDPTVTLSDGNKKLVLNKDYKITYTNDVNVGTAKVTVTGIGNYTGSKTMTYKIELGSTSLTSSPSYNNVKLTWRKVTGATGYQIYRSTKSSSGYKSLKTITSGSTISYTDKSVKFNTTYYYKIRAYRTVNGKKVYSAWSTVKKQKVQVTAPAIKKVSTGSFSVTLTWSKCSGASGYVVYRSSSKNGTYKKVSTVKGGTKVTYKNRNLKSSATYYYKVRAYRTVKGKNYYGSYSAIKSGTTKKAPKSEWRYINGYKLYYNSKGQQVKDVSKIIGKQSSYVIKVNKKKNVVTVYAKDGKNGYIIPVKSFVCSTGSATPTGTFYTPAKYRWQTLDGPSYGQWCTRITGHILFHSVWYYSRSNTTLSVREYNKLGTTASHGCIRLAAGDAKWIYDNCKLKTKVIIYNSNSTGPLGKPKASKLKSWHTWDPTDPNVKSKCKKKGCH